MDEQSTVLQIITTGPGKCCYQLITPGTLFRGCMLRLWNVEYDQGIVDETCREIAEKCDRAGRGNSDMEPEQLTAMIQSKGASLYNTLLPKNKMGDLRAALRSITTPLLIATNTPDVVWELLYDEDNSAFIGLNYNVGRRLLTGESPLNAPQEEDNWRCLMVANPNADEPAWNLPHAAVEAAHLKNWLQNRGINCDDYLEGVEATRSALQDRLQSQPYDMVYYAGHVVENRSGGGYAFRLNGGKLFGADSVVNLTKGTPIVFLNACWSSARRNLERPQGTGVEGMTDAFLHVGARMVIGSMFKVPDSGARAFAEKFFELFLSGEMAGAAMRAAREHVRNDPAYGATWAGFVLYGDPCSRLVIGRDELEEMLREIGLSRSDFEGSARGVLEKAYKHGLPGGIVRTPHLFAAMIGGENNHLATRLQEQGMPPEILEQAFRDAFAPEGSTKGDIPNE